jgi:hypothetical protein
MRTMQALRVFKRLSQLVRTLRNIGAKFAASPTATAQPPNNVHIATLESFLHSKGIRTKESENPAAHKLLSCVRSSAGKAGEPRQRDIQS